MVWVKVISGFLGVGKTTYLKNLLAKEGPGTAVLINEFGPLGIDKALVEKGSAADIVELASGCICCSLQRDLVEAILEIIEKVKPRKLVLEPSGVASTSGILKALASPVLAGKIELEVVVGIVDATSFLEDIEEGAFGSFYLDQVSNADVLLINKRDLVDPETIKRCEEEIARINPSALVIPTVYGEAEFEQNRQEKPVFHSHFAPGLDAVVLSPEGEFTEREIAAVLKDLPGGRYGQVVRAKGIFAGSGGPRHFDYVRGKAGFGIPAEMPGNRFVFIGRELQREILEKAFSKEIR